MNPRSGCPFLEYPIHVNCRFANRFLRGSVLASAAPFAMILLVISVGPSALAQFNNGAGPRGMSASPPAGPVHPPTVGVAPPTGAFGNGLPRVSSGAARGPFNGHATHPPHNSPPVVGYYPYFYPVAVPYADDANYAHDANGGDAPDQEADADSQDLAPTSAWIGSAGNVYARPNYYGPMRPPDPNSEDASTAQSASDPDPETPQTPTTLVFKDGHQIEINDYAIVGQTLYDLTEGHARKIALASLDLPATEKQNDDRGVVFQLPPSAMGN